MRAQTYASQADPDSRLVMSTADMILNFKRFWPGEYHSAQWAELTEDSIIPARHFFFMFHRMRHVQAVERLSTSRAVLLGAMPLVADKDSQPALRKAHREEVDEAYGHR